MDTKIDLSNLSQIPQPAIGFTAIHQGSPQEIAKSQAALQRALDYFDDLVQKTFDIGQTHLVVWGRGDLDQCCHFLPDASLLILIGSPSGIFTWKTISEKILNASSTEPFILSWEGRVILLRIDPTGNIWTLWNDWLGSIPVFHAETHSGWIASTLEPAVVDVLDVGEGEFFLPGLLGLLIWGHYFSDWTLFKSIKIIPPDCEAHWYPDGFQITFRFSVVPTDERWVSGRDEIMEEMYVLSRNAIVSVLKEHPRWILPLSSGLDSRLIAGVAAEIGVDVSAYTWGRPDSSDVIHSRRIAHVLGIPWKYLRPGNSYLTLYREQWADLFGSAMHFHGMYQMPFLDALKYEKHGHAPLISGFIGECLTGYDVKHLYEISQNPYPYQVQPDGYLHWTIQELQDLMIIPIDDAMAELAAEYKRQLEMLSGPLYQRLRFIVLWGRQRHFTYFQSMLSNYWRGVATPYLNREYARFSFSLPRAVLEGRIMQKAMFARYYPKLASIPGTYGYQPITLSGSYFLKKRISRYLPEQVAHTIFPGLYRTVSASEIDCVRHDKKDAFLPLFGKTTQLAALMNVEVINNTYKKTLISKDMQAVRKLQSIQTIAYRLSKRV